MQCNTRNRLTPAVHHFSKHKTQFESFKLFDNGYGFIGK